MAEQPGVKFIYIFCDDLQAMRHFYSELLDLDEIYYAAEPEGIVAYHCDGLQFTIIFHPNAEKVSPGWGWQPGWQMGQQPSLSWSVCLTEKGFIAAVDRLLSANVENFDTKPQWVNYWSFPVKDPMGNTVEVVFDPEQEPHNKIWQ